MAKRVTKAMKNAWVKGILQSYLLITFTDAGADEMRTRVAGAFKTEGFDVDPESIPAMTFNAFYMNVVKTFYKELGFTALPKVLKPEEIAPFIRPLIEGKNEVADLNYAISMESDLPQNPLFVTLNFFNAVKDGGYDLEDPDAEDDIYDELSYYLPKNSAHLPSRQAMAELLDRYSQFLDILKNENMLTFKDQELMAIEMLEKHPEWLKTLGIKHLIVDEMQDSNDYNMKLLCKFKEAECLTSFLGVGDVDQSIYGFRAANPENMTKFSQKIGCNVNQLFLSNNYRSRAEILDSAFKFVELNKGRIPQRAVAAKGEGGKYELKAKGTSDHMMDEVVKKLKVYMRKKGTVAVESYTKKTLQQVAKRLSKEGIPWVMKAPVKVLENSRVRGIIGITNCFFDLEQTEGVFSYLVAKYTDKIDELLTPEEINDEVDALRRYINSFENMSPSKQKSEFTKLINDLGDKDEIFNKWKEDLLEKEDLQSMIKYVCDYRDYGGRSELKMDTHYDGYVELTTAHSAKGLEWDHIVLILSDFDNKRLHAKRKDITKDIEEVRRLIFVAMTRAKENLFVTGQYVLYETDKEGEIFNQFLKELYLCRDDDSDTWVEEIHKMHVAKAEAEAARKRSYYTARKSSGKSKSSGKKSSSKKGKSGGKNLTVTITPSSKSKEMTADEKKAYNKKVKGSKQLNIYDFFA